MSNKKTVVKAATLILALSILGRLLGFVREMVIANRFGTSMMTDAYVMALNTLDIIYIVLGGALVAAFIPVFTSTDVHHGREAASRTASYITNIALLVMGLVTLLGVIFAPRLVALIAPGFSPEAREMTVDLVRIMFPYVLLTTVVSIQRGILNSLMHFAAPALTSVAFSATVIAAVYLLVPRWGIFGLAIGTVLAALAQVLIQVPPMFGKGLKYTPQVKLDDQGVRRIGELIWPVVIQMGVTQSYVFIERRLVSDLITGSLASLNFAKKLMNVPFNLFVTAINTAVFPSMSQMAAKKDYEGLAETMVFGINLISLFTLPAAVGLFVLSTPIVQLLFEHGAFNARSTAMTAFALEFYVIGLFGQGAFNVLNRTFYSLQDTRTPVVISIFVVGVNYLLSVLLIPYFQHGGLALSSSLASTLNMILVYLFLRRRLPAIPEKRLFLNLGKMLAASLLMGAVVHFSSPFLAMPFDLNTTSGQAFYLAAAMAEGLLVYAVLVVVFRVEEARYVYDRIRRYTGR